MTGTESIAKPVKKLRTEEQKARQAEARKKWRLENPERDREINRRSYEKKTKEEHAEATRLWRLANPEKERLARRKNKLRSTYGLSLDEYNAMFKAQSGVCKICGKPEIKMQKRGSDTNLTPESLHVDHDHATGAIRGLLCYRCNTALGKFDDRPDLLRKAAKYVEGKL